MTKRQLSIISAALILSVLAYAVAIFLMARASYVFNDWTMGWSLRESEQPLTFMMAGQAALAAIASLLLPKIFPRTLLQTITSSPATPGEGKFFPLIPKLSGTPERVLALLRLLLAEAIAVFGFMIAFLNRSPLWILPFAAIGLILQFLVGPFSNFSKEEV